MKQENKDKIVHLLRNMTQRHSGEGDRREFKVREEDLNEIWKVVSEDNNEVAG